MKRAVAILMGFVSGFLIYMMAAMLTADLSRGGSPSPLFVWVLFIGGWIASSWLILRGTASLSGVFRRGFLLGAAEWLTMALVGLVFSGRAVSSTITESGGSGAATAGAALGGGLMAAVTGGISVFMAVVCLIGFAVAYFTGREMSDLTATPTRKCPECAEMIQPDARKCRFCGTQLTPEAGNVGIGAKPGVAALDPARDYRPCPHCGESILSVAVVCKHCRQEVTPKFPTSTA